MLLCYGNFREIREIKSRYDNVFWLQRAIFIMNPHSQSKAVSYRVKLFVGEKKVE